MKKTLAPLHAALTLVACAVASAAPFPAASPRAVGLAPERAQALMDAVRSFVDKDEIVGGELLIIKDGHTILNEAAGWKDRESKTPLKPGALYCVRSMTKPVAGAALQTLIDSGDLSLDDHAAKFIPAFDTDASRPITIRQLLTHSSGLPLAWYPKPFGDYTSLREIVDGVGAHGPEFTPGDHFQYSDAGADTAGCIVSVASDKPLADVVQSRILDPLAMRSAVCVLSDNDPRLPEIPSAYSGGAGAWTRHWSPQSGPIFKFFKPAESLYCTTTDYAAFLDLYLHRGVAGDTRILSDDAVTRTLTPAEPMTGYPCGFTNCQPGYGELMMLYLVAPDHDDNTPLADRALLAFGHNGSDGTFAYAFPDRSMMVMLFTQSRGALIGARFEQAIQRCLLDGDPASPPAPAPPPQADAPGALASLAGVYVMKEQPLRVCVVSRRDDRLVADFPGRASMNLVAGGAPRTFAFEVSPAVTMAFDEPRDGVAPALTFTQQGSTARWERLRPAPDLPTADAALRMHASAHHSDILGGLYPISIEGTIDLPKRGTKIVYKALIAGPERFRVDTENAGAASALIVNGGRAWRTTPTGVEELDGVALDQALHSNPVLPALDWAGLFNEVSVLARTSDDDGHALVLVTRTTASPPTLRAIDAATGRAIGADFVQLLPGAGLVGGRVRYDDYRDVDGVAIPFHATSEFAHPLIGEIVSQFDNVQTHAQAPDAAFAPPTAEPSPKP